MNQNEMENALVSKIAIGTVNFGMDYGLSGRKKLTRVEVFQILDFGRSIGIWGVDTAKSYGESELVIGEFFKKHGDCFPVITKLPAIDYSREDQVKEQILDSMRQLNLQKIDFLLIHSYESYRKNKDTILAAVQDFKKIGLIGNYGISVYYPEEALEFIKEAKESVAVEFPLNLFDQRFLKENWIKKWGDQGHFLIARSVFLQGLLFFDEGRLVGPFRKVKEKIRKIREITETFEFPAGGLALLFVLTNSHVDVTVIGVDHLDQLASNLKMLLDKEILVRYQEVKDRLLDLEVTDEEIILPFNWGKS
jgi:aryl-alcohol dehydrogenase-like predicted oxidoreductase